MRPKPLSSRKPHLPPGKKYAPSVGLDKCGSRATGSGTAVVMSGYPGIVSAKGSGINGCRATGRKCVAAGDGCPAIGDNTKSDLPGKSLFTLLVAAGQKPSLQPQILYIAIRAIVLLPAKGFSRIVLICRKAIQNQGHPRAVFIESAHLQNLQGVLVDGQANL